MWSGYPTRAVTKQFDRWIADQIELVNSLVNRSGDELLDYTPTASPSNG